MKRLSLAALLLLVVACSDHSVTQYVGTVMNDAIPQTEGTLRLTLYARTDTSFSGVIDLGAPAHGTGSAYAWYVGPELHMVTVGAESGDTIRWTSRLTDQGLGGQFTITGGPRAQQQGTWRAHLVQGPPATPATLHSPRVRQLPPLSALWPLVLLLATVIGCARWIRGAPVHRMDWRAFPSPLSGVGGWLALFAIGQGLVLVTSSVRLSSEWHQYNGFSAAVTGMQPLIVLEVAMSTLVLPVVLVGLVLLVRRSPYAPRYWFAYFAVSCVYLLVDIVAMLFIDPHLQRLLGANVASNADAVALRLQSLQRLAFTLAWMLYWKRSARVRATFGAAALDRTVTAPIPAVDDATTPGPTTSRMRDGRHWRRVALRGVGVVLAGALTLLAYVLFSIHSSPYSVPAGTDIRTAVAGRWTWAHDTAGCRDAHTIAFADAGKVMTITSGSIQAAGTVTTYDILLASQSTIRGAIRGETRMTGDGKPVVWDLVLTGPDEYRWQRTDWRSTPWSYTGKIRRCPAPRRGAVRTP